MESFSRRRYLQSAAGSALAAGAQSAPRTARPRNIVFILSDDRRYDAMGFMHPRPWLPTPHLDTPARDGAHLKNAFVRTALRSPGRAGILTGVSAHRRRIVDNNTAIPPGKWHMGNAGDDPRPGFDKWVSFRGQGSYLPEKNGLNVYGKAMHAVRNQRNSWHGVDFPYHSTLHIGEYYKRCAETLMGIDDSGGRVSDKVVAGERNFPRTPTMHALRTDRYKYIHYYGIQDIDELYGKDTLAQLNKRLFDIMESSGGMRIPLYRDSGRQNNLRDAGRGKAADFPAELKAKKP